MLEGSGLRAGLALRDALHHVEICARILRRKIERALHHARHGLAVPARDREQPEVVALFQKHIRRVHVVRREDRRAPERREENKHEHHRQHAHHPERHHRPTAVLDHFQHRSLVLHRLRRGDVGRAGLRRLGRFAGGESLDRAGRRRRGRGRTRAGRRLRDQLRKPKPNDRQHRYE